MSKRATLSFTELINGTLRRVSSIDFTKRSIGFLLLSVIKAICRLYVLFVVQIRNGMSIHKFQEMSISGKMMYRSTS